MKLRELRLVNIASVHDMCSNNSPKTNKNLTKHPKEA